MTREAAAPGQDTQPPAGAPGELSVPYTQQFSPRQTPIDRLMGVLRQHAGDRPSLRRAIASAFFKDKSTAEKLAGNTLIALHTYGIIDSGAALTPFGRSLAAADRDEALRLLARRILLELHGIPIIETVREMQLAGTKVTLEVLPRELRDRGFQATDNSSDLSGMFGWLREAGVLDRYNVVAAEYAAVVGASVGQVEELKTLTAGQLCFLRAMVALGVTEFTPHNTVCRHAEGIYPGQVRYNWKDIDRDVLRPLKSLGYIEVRKRGKSTPGARGGKPADVKPTPKLHADLRDRVLSALARAAGYEALRDIASKSWADVVRDLRQGKDKDRRAKALELLAIKVCQTLDLRFMGWRETDESVTAGNEVDAMLHSSRLIYTRWQVQCKAASKVSVETIAKEVGAAQVTLANVILVVGTGRATRHAQTYRERIVKTSNLNIIVVEGHHLERIVEDPAAIVEVLNEQAADALRAKGEPLGVANGETPVDGGGDGGHNGGSGKPEDAARREPTDQGLDFSAAFATDFGEMYEGDALDVMRGLVADGRRVKLIMTSPPFALLRKKSYGNEDADRYISWFLRFVGLYKDILQPDGSLVIDIGGSWLRGLPVRSTYHFELLIRLCKSGFYLAQEFYHYNPSRLPTPAEWVTVRRLRVKDAINTVWWLVRDPFTPVDNRRVLRPYSDSMKGLIKNGYAAKVRPSGHEISKRFQKDNGGAIPPNLLTLANTESNSRYLRECRRLGIRPHPARFPRGLPEFFIKFLTDEGDTVLDPFAGSCVTGEAAEGLRRRWIGIEIDRTYVTGARVRFSTSEATVPDGMAIGSVGAEPTRGPNGRSAVRT